MKKREMAFPTIIGLIVAIGGLVAGLWLVQSQLRKESKASVEEMPKEVKISNVTDSSFTVSWITDKSLPGFLQYGKKDETTDLVVSDDRDQEKGEIQNYFTHYVTVTGLQPTTSYIYKIGSGKSMYDQNGEDYILQTAPALDTPPAADVSYGQVNTTEGEPSEGVIVYVQLPGARLQSALTKSSGAWVVPLSTTRTNDLSKYASYDLTKSALEIEVQSGPLGKAKVTTTTGGDSPVPLIVLGKNYDFIADNIPTPEASSSADVDTTSKFSGTANKSQLLLLSPQSGEGVNTNKPEIVGQAPAGTKVDIEIHSDTVIKANVVANNKGEFEYAVPTGLPPGEHTITITAVINGITKTVTKSFVVQAAGETDLPAFTATPSATLIPTGKVTTTPKPIVTKIPTPTLTEETELPTTGIVEWTWLIAGVGIALMVTGGLWYKIPA